MYDRNSLLLYSFSLISLIFINHTSFAQRILTSGFVAVKTILEDGIFSIGIGEQDLFITSELNDDFTFLGETVFKYSPNSPTEFNVSVERIIINYNYKGNHHVLIGKHPTPYILERHLPSWEGIFPYNPAAASFQCLHHTDSYNRDRHEGI